MLNMAPEERTERLGLRLSGQEHAMLTALADDRGVSLSDAARMAIRDAYKARFGERKPPKPKK